MDKLAYLQTVLADRPVISGLDVADILRQAGHKPGGRNFARSLEAIGYESAPRPYRDLSAGEMDTKPGKRGAFQRNPGECYYWQLNGRADRIYVRAFDTDGTFYTTEQIIAIALDFQREVNAQRTASRAHMDKRRQRKPGRRVVADYRASMVSWRVRLDKANEMRADGLTVPDYDAIVSQHAAARDAYHALLKERGEI